MALVDEIDELIPRRTVAGILTNLHREISEQTNAFRNFDTDLSLKLKNSFSESMAPLQERMLTTIEHLNAHLRSAEAHKQESITANLSSALTELRQSLSSTLVQMGDRFTEALSSKASGEFDRLSEALAGTTQLMQQMSVQSQSSQQQLNEVITHARNMTQEQLTIGRNQTEELTAVLSRLMTQMTETAGSSVAGISATLTAAMSDMSSKITELSDQMSISMTASSQKAADTANAVVEQAGSWTAKTSQQLNDLLNRHQALVDRIGNASQAMDGVMLQLKESGPQLAAVSNNLKAVAGEVSAATSRAAQAAAAMQTAQDAVAKPPAIPKPKFKQLLTWRNRFRATCRRTNRCLLVYVLSAGRY